MAKNYERNKTRWRVLQAPKFFSHLFQLYKLVLQNLTSQILLYLFGLPFRRNIAWYRIYFYNTLKIIWLIISIHTKLVLKPYSGKCCKTTAKENWDPKKFPVREVIKITVQLNVLACSSNNFSISFKILIAFAWFTHWKGRQADFFDLLNFYYENIKNKWSKCKTMWLSWRGWAWCT